MPKTVLVGFKPVLTEGFKPVLLRWGWAGDEPGYLEVLSYLP